MEIADIKINPTHRMAYKHKGFENDGIITGMFNVKPTHESEYRICYEVTYPDGYKDYIPVNNVENGYHKLNPMEFK